MWIFYGQLFKEWMSWWLAWVLYIFFLGVYWSEWLKFDFSFVCLSLFILFILNILICLLTTYLMCMLFFFGSYPWNCRHQKFKTQSQHNIFVDFLSFLFWKWVNVSHRKHIYIEGFKVNSFSCRIPIFFFLFLLSIAIKMQNQYCISDRMYDKSTVQTSIWKIVCDCK